MNESSLDLELFEKLKPELTSFCYRMLGSIVDADDAVQETYIRVWRSWDSFRQQSSRKTWIYRIASNVCIDKLRQAKRRALPVDIFDPAVSIIEPRETLPESSWIWPAPDFAGYYQNVNAPGNQDGLIVTWHILRKCRITAIHRNRQ